MILIPNISSHTFGVVGLGKSGRATIASLLASGARVLAWDDSAATREAVAREFPYAALAPIDQWDFGAMASLVMSPGIVLSHPAVKAAEVAGVEVIGDIELLYRAQPHARFIGITGTNGKSTTTSLIAHILMASGKRVEVGGNLGIPALALSPLPLEVPSPHPSPASGRGSHGIYVLELSSYQLDLVRTTRFHTAVFLNLTPDHLDHHGGMAEYFAAKQHIFDRQTPEDIAVIGVDDGYGESLARQWIADGSRRVIPISVTQHVGNGVEVEGKTLRARFLPDAPSADLSLIRSLQGAHNGQNAAAAYAVCAAVGIPHATIMAAMATFAGLPHRMQWLGEIDGVGYVNDSKATNADAAEKALLTYENIHWILGGVAKDGGIETLAKYFPKIRHAYVIGEAAVDFARTLEGHVAYTDCGTLEAAFASACNNARAGEVILLAPACASFDQFANFEKRGDAFVGLVEGVRG